MIVHGITPRSALLAIALAGALLLGAACGSGDDSRSAGIIHRLLVAGQLNGAGALESFAGRLPDGLPAIPPLFPDAELIVSSRQPAPFAGLDPALAGSDPERTVLYFIVLDTAAGRSEVFAYYEEALNEEPWQLESLASTEELDTLEFVKVDDVDIDGEVTIAMGAEDGRTSILISFQDAGADPEEEPPFELGSNVPLPLSFPADVPLYQGATITGTAFLRQPANESFFVILLTRDAQDDVLEFYRLTFERQGWTVDPRSAPGLADSIEFADARGDISGNVRVDRFSRDRRYTEVVIQLQQNPAREPAQPSG